MMWCTSAVGLKQHREVWTEAEIVNLFWMAGRSRLIHLQESLCVSKPSQKIHYFCQRVRYRTRMEAALGMHARTHVLHTHTRQTWCKHSPFTDVTSKLAPGLRHCAKPRSSWENRSRTSLEACSLEINIIKLSCQIAFGSGESAAIHKNLAIGHASAVFLAFVRFKHTHMHSNMLKKNTTHKETDTNTFTNKSIHMRTHTEAHTHLDHLGDLFMESNRDHTRNRRRFYFT